MKTGRPWTLDEIIDLAKTAVDNAVDNGSLAFQDEFEFQLHAPEHRGRPIPTAPQLAVALAIWNADERTRPESKAKGDSQ